jgi:hypothetical protein
MERMKALGWKQVFLLFCGLTLAGLWLIHGAIDLVSGR